MIRGGFVSFFLPIRTKVLESEEINKFLESLIWNHYLKLNFSTSLPELICSTLKTDFPKISCYFFSLLKRGCSRFSKAVSWALNRCESAIFSLINQNHKKKHFWRKKLFFIDWLIFWMEEVVNKKSAWVQLEQILTPAAFWESMKSSIFHLPKIDFEKVF